MALPNAINKDVPAGSDLPSTLDNRIRNLALAVEDLLGIPDQTNISAAGFGWDSTGLSSIRFQNAAVNPSVNGHLQRNGVNLMYHDGTSSYGLVLDTRAGVIANKTLNNPSITGTVSGSALYTSPTLSSPIITGAITGTLEFASTHTLALNPAWQINASVAANALTVAIKNVDGNDATSSSTIPFAFRSPTVTSGATIIGTMSTAQSVVVPATATLGFTASQTSRIWVGGYFEAGACKPFVYHALDTASSSFSIIPLASERVSTTAISTGADSAGVAYSTTAVTNAPWQWLGYIEIQTDATPGNWANNPTVIRNHSIGMKTSGALVQDVTRYDGALITGTTVLPKDDSFPQQATEGFRIIRADITGMSALNLFDIQASCTGGGSGGGGLALALFQDATANAISVSRQDFATANQAVVGFVRHRQRVGTAASTITFSVNAGDDAAGTVSINGEAGARLYGGVCYTYLTVQELMV